MSNKSVQLESALQPGKAIRGLTEYIFVCFTCGWRETIHARNKRQACTLAKNAGWFIKHRTWRCSSHKPLQALKPYVAYSVQAGPQEGAILVVAHSVREARKLAWGFCLNVDEWVDQAATLMPNTDVLALADQEALKCGLPHVIESPEHCASCEMWGCELTDDNRCSHCNGDPGERLLNLYKAHFANYLASLGDNLPFHYTE